MTKPFWEDTWKGVVEVIAQRSECDRAKVGAVIVDSHNRIVSVGYNGFVSKAFPDGWAKSHQSTCAECPRQKPSDPPFGCMLHAEMNALLFSDSRRVGGTIYVNRKPCYVCEQSILQSGIENIVSWESSPEYTKAST